MEFLRAHSGVRLLYFFVGFFSACYHQALSSDTTAPRLVVDANLTAGRPIPETLFGIFFEEINHAGSGGLWAELVCNRGFEAGGSITPSNIYPWSLIGKESIIQVSTDRSSCFKHNKVALKMNVSCGSKVNNICPVGGVGIFNPGFWGMNIEKGKAYRVIMYVRSSQSVNVFVSLTASNGTQQLATFNFITSSNWKKIEKILEANDTNPNSRLQLTTTSTGVLWFDQVSLMPVDTFKSHGFQKELFGMLANLKPRFMRFPGGCFVEGEWLRNSFHWKQTIKRWEERPGHFGDVWKYWTDDGLGYFEFLQLAEDLDALPVWVFNAGISHQDQVETPIILPFVQDTLDGIEFARGSLSSRWGSLRAKMGHPQPFDLRYVGVGNEDCGQVNYKGNYVRFYDAIKHVYPDIKIISNCDGSSQPLDHPADLYEFHIYTSAKELFSMSTKFNNAPRTGPKAFVSEYAVDGDAGKGTLLAALAEAGFMIGLERNSDVVEMASYAALFLNYNFGPVYHDAIIFNSSMQYGIPSYWVQWFFSNSSGATFLNTVLENNSSSSILTSAIAKQSSVDGKTYISIKIVNIGSDAWRIQFSLYGLGSTSIERNGSSKTILTSTNPMDYNSFAQPTKVVPVQSALVNAGKEMDVVIPPYSFTSFDLLTTNSK